MPHPAVAAIVLAAQPVNQPVNQPPPEPAGATRSTRDGATGDWAGARTALEDRGLTIGAEYVLEWSSVWAGGVANRASARDLLTLDAELDLERAAGLPGTTAFIQYLSVNPERGGSADAGDIQGYSNIENPFHIDAVYELWYEQRFLDDRLRVKLGKVDANTEFAAIEAAGDFAQSSAGFSPTISALPSYPNSATSINLFAEPVDGLTLAYALYDGASGPDGINTGTRGPSTFLSSDHSDDYFHVGELRLAWSDAGPFREGTARLGLWHHTGEFDRFDAGTEHGTTGVYLTAEQRLLPRRDLDGRGLYAFAQYGWADENVSEFAQHVGLGLVARGTFPDRDDDSAGVYVSLADLSDNPAAGFDDDELAIDTYYRVQVTPSAYVQPELHVIVNPSGRTDIDDAVVGSIRIGITF